MTRGLMVLLAVLAPGLSSGQTVGLATPPAASGQHTMMRAAGMPLNDGALAPGMLTVRIVQGAFTNNLSGQVVTVEVAGKNQTATSGPDGRAQFVHLPIGASVQAVAIVNGERLSSDIFPMPAESGVRVLLVAGGDNAGGVVASTPAPGVLALPGLARPNSVDVPTQEERAPATPPSVWIVAGALATASLIGFGLLLVRHGARTGP